MNRDNETFLEIVRLGLGHAGRVLPSHINWTAIETLAEQQGLSAVLVDGVERLPGDKRPPQTTLLQWIGETLQGYEYRYELYRRTIGELARWHNINGFKMMVLKGYACSLNWPKPEHRPCGDIDIWQFGKQKEADALLTKEKGIKIDKGHHHHTLFYWGDFMVENHYDFINVHHHKSNAAFEKILKEQAQDDSHFVDINGEKVYIPSPNLHSLFLLKHAAMEFAASSLNIRQILDWAFFVEKHTKEIDWGWLKKVMEKYHMTEFFNTINAICVENLGFEASIFPYVQFNPFLKEKVFTDILEPKFTKELPQSLIPRLVFKYRRWKGNSWKHEMCYGEGRWSAFWFGIWNHLLKPASI